MVTLPSKTHAVAIALAALALGALPVPGTAPSARAADRAEPTVDYRAAARELAPLIDARYAYRETLPDGRFALTPVLAAEADSVHDPRSLLRFAERALFLLADHHASTGSNLADSWGLVPSYSDLWLEKQSDAFVVTAVREGSPAAREGITPGARLLAVDGVAIRQAVSAFWADLGTTGSPVRDAFAARVLATGRRDRPRRLTLQLPGKPPRDYALANLYQAATGAEDATGPIAVSSAPDAATIRFANSLGDGDAIAAFDAAMARIDPATPVVIDLTDTPSGGNTVLARAIMGWFAKEATPYQRHADPAEERETGIAHQWLELVMPRGRYHAGPVTVRVGRWTGSMGEGLAIGLAQLGAHVCGGPMAGLRGSIESFPLGDSGVRIAFPTQRLMTVNGTPREEIVPPPCEAGG